MVVLRPLPSRAPRRMPELGERRRSIGNPFVHLAMLLLGMAAGAALAQLPW